MTVYNDPVRQYIQDLFVPQDDAQRFILEDVELRQGLRR